MSSASLGQYFLMFLSSMQMWSISPNTPKTALIASMMYLLMMDSMPRMKKSAMRRAMTWKTSPPEQVLTGPSCGACSLTVRWGGCGSGRFECVVYQVLHPDGLHLCARNASVRRSGCVCMGSKCAAYEHPHLAQARRPQPQRQPAVGRQPHRLGKVVEEGLKAPYKCRPAVVRARRRAHRARRRARVAPVARDAVERLALEHALVLAGARHLQLLLAVDARRGHQHARVVQARL